MSMGKRGDRTCSTPKTTGDMILNGTMKRTWIGRFMFIISACCSIDLLQCLIPCWCSLVGEQSLFRTTKLLWLLIPMNQASKMIDEPS